MEEDNVRTVGNCNGCSKFGALSAGVCKECTRKFGPRFGGLAAKIRENPGFKNVCYTALKTEHARSEFVTMFGGEEQAYAMISTTPSQGSH
jgi:predicted amidophosphoribosyltransferase